MSMRVDYTAQMYPAVLCWLCLVAVFLATGTWVGRMAQAREHPVLLGAIGVVFLVSAGLFASGTPRRVGGFFAGLLVTLPTSGFVLIRALAKIRIFEFTLGARHFGLGTAVLTGLPALFVAYVVVSIPIVALLH